MITANISYDWNTVVLQPTTLCNLNCGYCYLPDRKVKSYLNEEVVKKVAETVNSRERHTLVLWHGGEPLLTGIEKLENYVSFFEPSVKNNLCTHSLQTNATLISDRFCELFKKNKFRIGVSLDGNEELNSSRVFWNNKTSYTAAIQGIEILKKNNIKFSVIAVVNKNNIENPEVFYDFMCNLGISSVSINIEELEGYNAKNQIVETEMVMDFWSRLFIAWKKNPILSIRQFRDALQVMLDMRTDKDLDKKFGKLLYPTIDTEGNVVLLSPEFISVDKKERDKFIIGNILEKSLPEIIREGLETWYVQDFISGLNKCYQSCEYFSFCKGGQASNKWFEHGNLNTTETKYCKHSRIAPVEAILKCV